MSATANPVGEDQDWRGGEVAEKLSYGGFHGRGEHKFDPLLEQDRGGAYARRQVSEGFLEAANATNEQTGLLCVRRRGRFSYGSNIVTC